MRILHPLRVVRALDSESKGPGFESAAGQHLVLVSLSKVLYLIVLWFRKSCEEVGSVYWKRNI